MCTLEKLIAKLCPDGVEYKQLGEICDFNNGYTPSKSCSEYWNDGNVPWFRLEDIRVNGRVLTDSIQHITKVAVKGALFPANSLIVSTSATIGEYALVLVPALTNQRFTALSIKSEFASKIDVGFLKHMGYVIGEYCKDNINQGNFASVDMKAFRKFMFPIPPLSVQKEIVRMLDDMAGLIDALEEELAARKKQYEWCRERLLTFGDDVEYKPLGEFCSYVRGVTYSKEQEAGSQIDSIGLLRANNIELTSSRLLLEDVKYIKSTVKINSMQWLKKGDILICAGSGSREHIGKVAFIEHDMDFVFGGFMAAIRCKEKLVSKFLFHVLRSVPFKNHLGLVLNSSTINNLKSECVYSFQLPIPPLHVQNKIVHTLDDMTALIAALEEELAARKQQYEYYRDKLLAFKRAG